MKPFLLLVFTMLGISITTWAVGTQSAGKWRWRNNNGTETSATWKAAVNTPVTLNVIGAPEVLRLRVVVNAGCAPNNNPPGGGGGACSSFTQRDSLQYSTTPTNALSWVTIGSSTNKVFKMVGADSYVAQQQPTTRQIDSSSTRFTAGVMMVADSVIKGYSLQAPTVSESEWVFMPTVTLPFSTTYYFRQWGATRTLSTAYVYPSFITSAPPPVQIARFVVVAEDKKAKLQWETVSEPYNDRFEVQRSPDQRIWQTVAVVRGTGTATTAAQYTAYDNNLLPGITYYRLQQFDKDGKSTLSSTLLLKVEIIGNTTQFVVFPNPVQGAVRFVNTGAAVENTTAIVSDVSGKIIYRQPFGNVPGGSIRTLNMAVPPPGLYLLRLNGSAIAETIKLIIK